MFVFCNCPARALKNLDLGGNDAGPDAAATLAQALLQHPSLQLLELGYNPLGPGGAATIAGLLALAARFVTSHAWFVV